MLSDEELRFSIRADVPKENLHALDDVLNELFGTLSSKMKQAGDFLDSVKMRPPRVEDGKESDSDDIPDLISEPEKESEDSDSEHSEETESDHDADDEDEVDHVFLILIDGVVLGYSPTLRGAMETMEDAYGEFTATHQGPFRTEQTPTSLRVYRRTPYVWFMFSEQIALEVEIKVTPRV